MDMPKWDSACREAVAEKHHYSGPCHLMNRFSTFGRVAFALALLGCLAGGAAAADPQDAPEFAEFAAYVKRDFANKSYYRDGDIITDSEVKPIFRAFALMGWQPTNAGKILASLPSDTEFLVRKLRSGAGRKFMEKIAVYPDGYDRLDRMSRLPRGKQLVHDLINGVGGYELVQYMTTTDGGKNLGKQLSRDPDGKGFNKPTGRIYTVDQLIDVLRKSYQQSHR